MINIYELIGKISCGEDITLDDLSSHVSYTFKINDIMILKSFMDTNKKSVIIEEKLLIEYLDAVANVMNTVIRVGSTSPATTSMGKYLDKLGQMI